MIMEMSISSLLRKSNVIFIEVLHQLVSVLLCYMHVTSLIVHHELSEVRRSTERGVHATVCYRGLMEKTQGFRNPARNHGCWKSRDTWTLSNPGRGFGIL